MVQQIKIGNTIITIHRPTDDAERERNERYARSILADYASAINRSRAERNQK